MHQLEPDFSVFLFIIRGLLENAADLFKTILFGFGSLEGVFVAGLAFAGKRGKQIGFGFGTFENFHIHKTPLSESLWIVSPKKTRFIQ